MTTARTVGIEEVLRALRKGWAVVFGCALMAWAIAYSAAGKEESIYQSDARLVVAPAELDEVRDVIDTSAGLERESVTTTLAELMDGTEMRERIAVDARVAGVDLSQYSTESAAEPLSNLVTLSVRGPDGEAARRLARIIVQSTRSYFESLYPIYRVDEVDAPSLPTSRVAPTPARDGALAAFGGAALGVALVVAVWGWRRASEPDGEAPGSADVPDEPRLQLVDALRSFEALADAGRGQLDGGNEAPVQKPDRPPARAKPRRPPTAARAAGDG